uniref:Uncharacterized protein n=1 Tax=Ditylenchus dipsaci TaxID=166011 RepID=A0A915EV70_9BILA
MLLLKTGDSVSSILTGEKTTGEASTIAAEEETGAGTTWTAEVEDSSLLHLSNTSGELPMHLRLEILFLHHLDWKETTGEASTIAAEEETGAGTTWTAEVEEFLFFFI